MWTRKSDGEIREYLEREEAKRRSLLRPFFFALGLTAGALALYGLGLRGGWLRGGMVLVSSPGLSGARALAAGLFFFTLFFAVAVYNQRRRGPSSYNPGDSLLCGECRQPSAANASGVCRCGGRLEPFAFFNWNEAEESPAEA